MQGEEGREGLVSRQDRLEGKERQEEGSEDQQVPDAHENPGHPGPPQPGPLPRWPPLLHHLDPRHSAQSVDAHEEGERPPVPPRASPVAAHPRRAPEAS